MRPPQYFSVNVNHLPSLSFCLNCKMQKGIKSIPQDSKISEWRQDGNKHLGANKTLYHICNSQNISIQLIYKIAYGVDMDTVSIYSNHDNTEPVFQNPVSSLPRQHFGLHKCVRTLKSAVQVGSSLALAHTHTVSCPSPFLPSFQWWAGSLVLTNIYSLTRVGIYSIYESKSF